MHETADGDEGLATALELTPDIVLLDLGLPRRSGWDVAGALRQAGFQGGIIVVSAHATGHDMAPPEALRRIQRAGRECSRERRHTRDHYRSARFRPLPMLNVSVGLDRAGFLGFDWLDAIPPASAIRMPI